MPDFRQYVRQRLPELRVNPAREDEIVSELALQLEQAYSDGLANGLSEGAALSRAASQFGDWSKLAREIQAAERYSEPAPEQRAGIFSGAGRMYATPCAFSAGIRPSPPSPRARWPSASVVTPPFSRWWTRSPCVACRIPMRTA
jgi:hypothetical protein